MPAGQIRIDFSGIKNLDPIRIFAIFVDHLIRGRRSRSAPGAVGGKEFSDDNVWWRDIGVEEIAPTASRHEGVRRRSQIGNSVIGSPRYLDRSRGGLREGKE